MYNECGLGFGVGFALGLDSESVWDVGVLGRCIKCRSCMRKFKVSANDTFPCSFHYRKSN